jgi:hypothetical protein
VLVLPLAVPRGPGASVSAMLQRGESVLPLSLPRNTVKSSVWGLLAGSLPLQLPVVADTASALVGTTSTMAEVDLARCSCTDDEQAAELCFASEPRTGGTAGDCAALPSWTEVLLLLLLPTPSACDMLAFMNAGGLPSDLKLWLLITRLPSTQSLVFEVTLWSLGCLLGSFAFGRPAAVDFLTRVRVEEGQGDCMQDGRVDVGPVSVGWWGSVCRGG